MISTISLSASETNDRSSLWVSKNLIMFYSLLRLLESVIYDLKVLVFLFVNKGDKIDIDESDSSSDSDEIS